MSVTKKIEDKLLTQINTDENINAVKSSSPTKEKISVLNRKELYFIYKNKDR